MSFEAMRWASEQHAGASINKLLLLLLGNYADQNYECFPSIGKLAKMAEASESTIRRSLRDLEARGLIKINERFQTYGDKHRQTSNTYILQTGCQIDTHPPVTMTPTPLSNSIGDITSHNNQSEYTDDFLQFWGAYPKRPNSSKRNASKKYKIAIRKTTPEEILKATKKFAKTQINKEPQFIPHAATWLHQERYADIMEEPTLKTNRNRIAG